jgi:hypothetical protein
MKSHAWILVLITAVLVLSGCGASGPSGDALLDREALVKRLEAEGAKVEIMEPIQQEFFTPPAQMINFDEAGIQVYEYESPEKMEAEAARVSPEGSSIGTSMVSWIEPPHFLKAGRIIVLYLGSDEGTIQLLEKILGPQFAGQ